MKLKEYLREIELMNQQYGQEEELYPLVDRLLRNGDNMADLSLRMVAKGRSMKSTDSSRKFLKQYSSFPDLVILDEKFDKILLDVPCLGIGVIKRKPDIKWQRKPEDIEEITLIQRKILENCSKYLKKGGTLVYSTCSILKEENEEIVIKFLSENKQFEIDGENMVNILPNKEKDGFFICKIYRKK